MNNSVENWVLLVDPSVHKEVDRFPKQDAMRWSEVIGLLTKDPYMGDIENMKGEENSWRRRIGNYRIFYKLIVNKKIIIVNRVERRTSNTY